MTSVSNEQLLKPEDLAEILNVSKDTIYRYVQKRSIPFYKFGGNLRFDRNEILKFLSDHRVEPIIRK